MQPSFLLHCAPLWQAAQSCDLTPVHAAMHRQSCTTVHNHCVCVCRYPVVRLAIAASPLQLHLSPYRYQQLMTVLQSSLAAPEGATTAAATSSSAAKAAGDKPLWLSEAEHRAKVSSCYMPDQHLAKCHNRSLHHAYASIQLLRPSAWHGRAQQVQAIGLPARI
jgi:hypothetical protein